MGARSFQHRRDPSSTTEHQTLTFLLGKKKERKETQMPPECDTHRVWRSRTNGNEDEEEEEEEGKAGI
jgi:hypothetical protein